MKKYLLLILLGITTSVVHSQDITDALRFAQVNLKGTARFSAMGGAFGALGGDFSSLNVNPAGSAIFNNNQIALTFNSFGIKNNSSYFGTKTSEKNSSSDLNEFGAVYGFIIPTEMAAKMAGEWQAYDITLIGRMITVVANGKTIICNQEIPGITGGALDSNEGEPGPIYLQGDHGPVEYRNMVITPAKN
jgi:hypothetical protein